MFAGAEMTSGRVDAQTPDVIAAAVVYLAFVFVWTGEKTINKSTTKDTAEYTEFRWSAVAALPKREYELSNCVILCNII